MPGLQILLFAAFAIIAIVGVFYASEARKKRRLALFEMATRLGLKFSPLRDSSHDDQYAHFEIFRHGHSRYAYNTMSGVLTVNGRPYPCKLGDFTYKTREGSGKNRRTVTHRFSYLIAHLPFTGLPDLLIRHESMFDKLAGVFGMDDIDFESAAFSRAFHVKSPDKKFAYDVCHQRMIEFLMRSNPPTIDLENGRLCLSDGRSQWSPAQFEQTIAWLEDFFEQWPEFLLTELDRKSGRTNP
ncbi:MAG: hypothetical protein ACI89L_002768 [Phycisphaerales bacterium]|jgi:hypothetical protein